MSRAERPKAQTKAVHWRTISLAMVEGITNILLGKEFGRNLAAINAAQRFLKLAIEGFIATNWKSEVYSLAKEVIYSCFGTNNDARVVSYLNTWLKILSRKGKPFSACDNPETREQMEKMRYFFGALHQRGEKELSFLLLSDENDE